MKTETRSQILKMIGDKGKLRPSELKTTLNLSAQSIHKHLKNLVTAGLIEPKGSAPHTQYVMAGVPELTGVSTWVNEKNLDKSPEDFVCASRDVLDGRLPRLKNYLHEGMSLGILSLVISTAGEIGNNSFDHNLGQWRDVPGCWFETQATGKSLWICIADRGQGIFSSLSKAHPEIKSEQEALNAAFERIISGRTPEQRGNGLKYVKGNLINTSGGGIACLSGSAEVSYGDRGAKCLSFLKKNFRKVMGTVTLMVWELQ